MSVTVNESESLLLKKHVRSAPAGYGHRDAPLWVTESNETANRWAAQYESGNGNYLIIPGGMLGGLIIEDVRSVRPCNAPARLLW